MARITSTTLVLSLVLLSFGVTGCSSASADSSPTSSAASGGPLVEWSRIRDTIASSIQPTFDAFDGTWDVQLSAPPESACWTKREGMSDPPRWEKKSDGYEVAFFAKNSWFDANEDPWTTAERSAYGHSGLSSRCRETCP